ISAFLLISFSSFAAVENNKSNVEKAGKRITKSVAGKRSAKLFAGTSKAYTKDGLVKRKGRSNKSCPAFEF
ncbi:hypothetical protein OB13_20555, partial [Pontibacter sp. HJ8]